MKKNNFFKLELLILSVLNRKDCYGYEICTIIRDKTNGIFDIKEGVMYPILYNLLTNSYISSYEKVFNRRIRVYYHIEDTGKVYLDELDKEFKSKLKLILDFLSN